MTMTPEFTRGTRLHASDLNRLASEAASAHPGFNGFLAADNGSGLSLRSPRRDAAPRGLRIAIGAIPVDGGVLGAVDTAKRGPRTAVVYNPATGQIGEAVVCPAEIAGQFPATDAHMETYVVAIQCVVSEAGSGAEGR